MGFPKWVCDNFSTGQTNGSELCSVLHFKLFRRVWFECWPFDMKYYIWDWRGDLILVWCSDKMLSRHHYEPWTGNLITLHSPHCQQAQYFKLNVSSDQILKSCLEKILEIPNLLVNITHSPRIKLNLLKNWAPVLISGGQGGRADCRRVTGRLIPGLQTRLQVYLNIPSSHFILFMGLTLTELSIYSLYVETQFSAPSPDLIIAITTGSSRTDPPNLFSHEMFSHIKSSKHNLKLFINSNFSPTIVSVYADNPGVAKSP